MVRPPLDRRLPGGRRGVNGPAPRGPGRGAARRAGPGGRSVLDTGQSPPASGTVPTGGVVVPVIPAGDDVAGEDVVVGAGAGAGRGAGPGAGGAGPRTAGAPSRSVGGEPGGPGRALPPAAGP